MRTRSSVVSGVEDRFRNQDALARRRDPPHAKDRYHDAVDSALSHRLSHRKYTTASEPRHHFRSSAVDSGGLLSRRTGRSELASTTLAAFRDDLDLNEQKTPLDRSVTASTRAVSRILHAPSRWANEKPKKSASTLHDTADDIPRTASWTSAALRAKLHTDETASNRSHTRHASFLARPGHSYVSKTGHVERSTSSIPDSPSATLRRTEREFTERLNGVSVSPNLLSKVMANRAATAPDSALLPGNRGKRSAHRPQIETAFKRGQVLVKTVEFQADNARFTAIRDEEEERLTVEASHNADREMRHLALEHAIEGIGQISTGDALELLQGGSSPGRHARRSTSTVSSRNSHRLAATRSIESSRATRQHGEESQYLSDEMRLQNSIELQKGQDIRSTSRHQHTEAKMDEASHIKQSRAEDRRAKAKQLSDLLETRN